MKDEDKELVKQASELATGLICCNDMLAGTTLRKCVQAIERLSAEVADLKETNEAIKEIARLAANDNEALRAQIAEAQPSTPQ